MPQSLAELVALSKASRSGAQNVPVYDDAYLKQHSVQGLDRVTAPAQQPYGTAHAPLASPYDKKEYPLVKATQFLQDTQGDVDQRKLAGRVAADTVAPHRPSMPERIVDAAVPAGRAAAMVGSFLAPEVAIPSDMILGMDAGADLLHNGMEGVQEHPIRSALEALQALSGVSRLSKAASMNPGKFPATVRGGEDLAGTMQPYKAADSIPDVAHMYDAEDLGVEAGDQAIKTATRSKSSRAVLGQLKQAGKDSRFNMWARDNVDELVRDESGRVVAPKQQTAGPHPTSAQGKHPYAKYATHQPGLPGEDPTALFNVVGGDFDGSTKSAAELLKHGIQIEGGIPAYDPAAIKAARDAALARMMRIPQE